LYQAFRDAPHSLCLAAASRIAFRLTTRISNLRKLRSIRQAEVCACRPCFGFGIERAHSLVPV
jgi:hypothetical protein